jgi:putative Mg2+ transporter-C (MgtC) family protein
LLDAIAQTLAAEFSDLHDTAAWTRTISRLLVACILGGLLGFNREHHGKSAGLRTHVLVALGACVFTMAPQQAGADPAAMTRVVQGLVVGIGFLGAGAIFKGDRPGEVNGLTTAAGIWATAAIGMTAGYGREVTAIVSTAFAMIVLAVVPHVRPKVINKDSTKA